MSGYHLAQLNVGRAHGPTDDPVMEGFVSNLEQINALGETMPGFVWRLQDESGDATSIKVFDDPRVIINLTVWESAEQLAEFAYRSRHVEFFRRRREWFEPYGSPSLVLWWLPAGELPTIDEAKRRLTILTENGPSAEAFTLKVRFPPPSNATAPADEATAPTAAIAAVQPDAVQSEAV